MQLAISAALFIGVGFVASRADRNEAFAKRVAAVVFTVIMVVFALSVARGEFMRFAPGAEDASEGEQRALP